MEFNLDGIDLTSDTAKADILALVEKHTLGLRNKRDELLGLLSSAKSDIEQSKLDAEQEKHTLAKELATEKGSVADYKLALDAEKESMTLLKLSFQEEKDGRTLSDALNDFSITLVDDPAGRMYMQSLFKGAVEIKDGLIVSKDTTKTIDEVKQSLVSDKANAKYIKAGVGSGLGSQGSEGGFDKVKSLKEMTATEEAALANSNPELYQSLLTK